MKIFLFDSTEAHENLLPLSFTRPIALFRVGILTLIEKWQRLLPGDYHMIAPQYLRDKFGQAPDPDTEALFINAALLPSPELIGEIPTLPENSAFTYQDTVLVFKGPFGMLEKKSFSSIPLPSSLLPLEERFIKFTFDITRLNPSQIEADFKLLTQGRVSAPLDPSNTVVGDLNFPDGSPKLFIEEGADVCCAVINLRKGPVYIGKDAEIMENAVVRGPLALCEKAQIRIGSKIYPGCTFGPFCKVGGEIDHTVMFGYSNKAHDGYLGDAVVGEWCNIGAGVNASNLKNDYTKIRVWNYRSHTFMRTDLQFCGPIIGDHTKVGVNCMLNTATVLGVGVNIHGAGFPRVFIPSFSEGTAATGFTDVPMKKFFDIAERAMARRGIKLTDSDRQIYERIREVAATLK